MPYRPTERTEAHRAATRERIVAAALDQVSEGGYGSASIQSVARRAGVATGTMYRHFASKPDLFAEVFRRASQRELDVIARHAAAADRPAGERLAACVEAFSRRALAGPALAYAQIAEPVDARVDQERLLLRRGYRDVFAGLLRDGVVAGEWPALDVEVAAAGLVGAIGEALVGPLSPVAGSPPSRGRRHEALVASIVQFCSHAIRQEAPDDRQVSRAAQHA